jgi:hypothetical protein
MKRFIITIVILFSFVVSYKAQMNMADVSAYIGKHESRLTALEGGITTISGKIYYVNGWNGSNSFDGKTRSKAFKTMTHAFTKINSGDAIVLIGKIAEDCAAPSNVFDVTIIGAANRARHGTSGGIQAGYASHWMPAAVGTSTYCLTLREQGWRIENILFQTPTATTTCAIKLLNSNAGEGVGIEKDPSHLIIRNCRFTGPGIGIDDNGGATDVLIEDCIFQSMAFGIKTTSTGVRVPFGWIIQYNDFWDNTNDITISMNYGTIKSNTFHSVGAGATNKIISTTYVSTQGGYNKVILNFFNNVVAYIVAAQGYTGAATDQWCNYVTDQAALAIGQPTP